MFVKQMQVSSMAVFAYIVGDPITGDALVIDPADNIKGIVAEAQKIICGLIISSIRTAMWITSAAIRKCRKQRARKLSSIRTTP